MKNELNKIGLIIADKNEIHDLREFKIIKSFNGQFVVDLYNFNKINVYVINSGIGLVNAAMATQYLIDNFKVKQIWNYGAVGSLGKYKIFDVVIPQKFYYFDVQTPWYPIGQVPGENHFFVNKISDNNNCNIASGNSFIYNKKDIDFIKKKLDVDIIDMECCAIAHVCKKNKIDFFCIKAISDIIGKNKFEKDKINDLIKKSSQLALDAMIKKMKEIWEK